MDARFSYGIVNHHSAKHEQHSNRDSHHDVTLSDKKILRPYDEFHYGIGPHFLFLFAILNIHGTPPSLKCYLLP
jgi:hypothetical protein